MSKYEHVFGSEQPEKRGMCVCWGGGMVRDCSGADGTGSGKRAREHQRLPGEKVSLLPQRCIYAFVLLKPHPNPSCTREGEKGACEG